MKHLLKTLKIIVITILSTVLLINVFTLTSKYVFKQDPPKIFKYFSAIVLQGSMEPTFSKGDLLVFKEYDNYNVNDIVIFKEEDSFVTHRIVEIKDCKYVTRGDANNVDDRIVLSLDDIEGKAISIIPKVGTISDFFTSTLGLLIIIIGSLLAFEIPNLFANYKSRRANNEA